MSKPNFLMAIMVFSILIYGCSSQENITGEATEPSIFEEPQGDFSEAIDSEILQDSEEIMDNDAAPAENIPVENVENEIIEEAVITTEPAEEKIETVVVDNIDNGFHFAPTSIVGTQNNISISIDNITSEIKSEYWGKITGIKTTILNHGSRSFKPKVIVLLHDEKDAQDQWLVPKAEILFDVEQLRQDEHTTKDAIVSISFDDIALVKRFQLVLVDHSDIGNKPLAVAEYDFNPIAKYTN